MIFLKKVFIIPVVSSHWLDMGNIHHTQTRNITAIVDKCGVARKVIYSNFSLVTLLPGKRERMHFHGKMEELYFCLLGYGRIAYVDGEKEIKGPREFIAVPKGMMHMIVNDSQANPLELIAVNNPVYDAADVLFEEDLKYIEEEGK